MFRNFMRAALALGLVFVFAFAAGIAVQPAAALNVDQNRIPQTRIFPYQMIHYYRLTINYNDPRIGTGQLFGYLPAGSYILSIDADVTTAFNAGTTNYVTIGATQASANEIVGNSTLTAGTAAVSHLTTAPGLGLVVTDNATYQNTYGDVPLYAKFAQTGTAATTGSVTFVIAYIPNNDL